MSETDIESNGTVAEDEPTFKIITETPPKPQMRGHLKITTRPEAKGCERLRSFDFDYELDGVDIGSRLAGLEFKLDLKRSVLVANLEVYITDLELDAEAVEIFTALKMKQPRDSSLVAQIEGDLERVGS